MSVDRPGPPSRPVPVTSARGRALLAYLAMQPGHSSGRDKLAGLLWGDRSEVQARQSLRQCLLILRRDLGEIGSDMLVARRDSVGLDPDRLRTDAGELAALSGSGNLDDLKRAADLYRGPFLGDLALESEGFDEWARAERARLQAVALRALDALARTLADEGRGIDAIAAAERLVAIDPLLEDSHRLLIEIYGRFRGRSAALAHAKSLSALLRTELAVGLDPSTVRLVETIENGSIASGGVRRHIVRGSGHQLAPWPGEAPDGRRDGSPIPHEVLALPDGLPSIAVLPLRNADPDQATDYFGEGVVEDIIVSLGSLGELFVISRGSTLAYRGRDVDPCEVGRDLGVAYVVAGTVRRTGDRLRVYVELCDARTGEALWSDRTQLPAREIFDLQDECVSAFVSRIAPKIRGSELKRAMRKRPEAFSAYDCTLQALDLLHRNTDETFVRAGSLLDQAIDREPTFALPHAWASWSRSIGVWQGRSSDPAGSLSDAVDLARKAIELDPRHALALATYGHLKSTLQHDHDGAEHCLGSALRSCPNHAFAWLMSSFTQSYRGHPDEALVHAKKALRLSPLDQGRFYHLTAIAVAHYAAGRFDEAVTWAERSRREDPTFTANLRYLAAALVGAGREDTARGVAADLLTQAPRFRLSTYKSPYRDKALKAEHLRRLRHAGIPD